jgi:DNA-binding transcriptional LysR family regulator
MVETTPDLRLVRYFVAVAREGNVTRAAAALRISQPSLSAAVKRLEEQLGVALVERDGRGIRITSAGELMLRRGRDLLAQADAVADEVRNRAAAPSGRIRLGISPTARYGVAPELLAACAAKVPAVMVYTSEDTTGALLRDVAAGRLDLALTFCAPDPGGDMELLLVRDEPAVVHLPADHPLAKRESLALEELAGETILVAASSDSSGFTERVLSAFSERGIVPRTRVDPHPDLGLQAVREGLGLVLYARSAFPANLAGSAFVPLAGDLVLPFQLAFRRGAGSAPLRELLGVAKTLGASAAGEPPIDAD